MRIIHLYQKKSFTPDLDLYLGNYHPWEIYDEEGNHISSFNQNADSIDDDMIHLFDGFYSVTGEKILSLEPIEIDFANAKGVSLGGAMNRGYISCCRRVVAN